MSGFGVPGYSHNVGTIDLSLLPQAFTVLTNCRLCINGNLISEPSTIVISGDSGRIEEILKGVHVGSHARTEAHIVDLENGILAPGLLELQTNGMRGFHFTHFTDDKTYARKIDDIARYLATQGVTGFWATVPTVAIDEFKKILPCLAPRTIQDGATLLGAHAEGPYLHPSKKGAHNSSLFQHPSTPATEVYGVTASSKEILKLVTVAPELKNACALISDLASRGICVSLGHSNATLEEGIEGVRAGATGLTHTLNAMTPLHHRNPGLAGLVVSAPSALPSMPWFSIIPDGHHLHPAIARMLLRLNMSKCIVITDSIELAGLPDGTYPGHSQIPLNQTKKGSKVMIEGTDTLIGGCASLIECARNLKRWSDCSFAEVVRCATENIVDFMGDVERGKLEVGRRADFAVFDDHGNVLQTWINGKMAWKAG